MSNRVAQTSIDGAQKAIGKRSLRWLILYAFAILILVSCEPLDDGSSAPVEAESPRLPQAQEAIDEVKEEVESTTEELDEYEEDEVEDLVQALNEVEPEELQDSGTNVVVSVRDRIDALRGAR